MSSLPMQFLVLTLARWMTRDQQRVTEYLVAENAVLREQLRGRRIRYTDAQRRRLATAAKNLGRKALQQLASRRVEVAGIVEQPHEALMKQLARNLTDAADGFLLKHS